MPTIQAHHAAAQATGVAGFYRLRGDAADLTALRSFLASQPSVKYVEEPQAVHVATTTPNDPKFTDGTLWGLNGTNGIRAPQAWDISHGSTKMTVAVIDTGIDYDHPDLYENIWINQAEIPASRKANLTDVDGDGLITFYDLNNSVNQGPGKITDINGDGRIDAADILSAMQKDANGKDTGNGGWADGVSEDGDTTHLDDLVGWNFVANTNNPFDDNGHGTHVSGTIGAMGNNGIGVVGVNWQAQLMPVKFLNSSGNGSTDNAALAIRYAADHGARVSNNSWLDSTGSQAEQDAIDYAANKNYGPSQGVGMVVVAAAGNSAQNTDTTPVYPSAYPESNILSVASIDSNGNLSSFSNYGAVTVDVAAPGRGIYSTLPGNSYGSLDGTSMATPHATGTAALLLLQNPAWSAAQVVNRIIDTATPDSSLTGKTVSGGIVNAQAALQPYTSDVALSSYFNRLAIATDGTTFSSTGGVDASGHALSANLLGPSVTWRGLDFTTGPANSNDVVAALGQSVSLPAGYYSSLNFLATTSWNSYANQTFTVTYTDNTTEPFTQSFSIWTAPQSYAGESVVSTMGHSDNYDGTTTTQNVYVYGYSFALDSTKQVKSITLPNQGKINILGITLA